jgi:anti-sigma B factor antagonist
MKISTRKEGRVLVITLDGRMSIGEGDSIAGEAIRSAVAAGEKKVLLDMKKVSVLDSSGVGELVSSYTSALRRGGTVKIYGLAPRVGEVLKATRLVGIFELFDDDVAAIESFT